MVNYQSILYPIVRSYLNSSDDITKFKDLCEELATIKTVEDCEQKSKILCEYLHNECNIQNVTKSKIKFKYVQELGSVLNQIKNSKLVNEPFNQGSFTYNAYGKIVSYVCKYPDDEKVNTVNLESTEDIDDSTFNSFINGLNVIKDSFKDQQTMQSVISNILSFLISNNIVTSKKENFEELYYPVKLYEFITNQENINIFNVDTYISQYQKLTKDADDTILNEVLMFISGNQFSIQVDQNDNTTIITQLLESEFKDKQTVDQFIKSLNNVDDVTMDDIKKWNDKLISIVKDILQQNENNQKFIDSLQQTLNTNVQIVIDFNGNTITKKLSQVLIDISNSDKLLSSPYDNKLSDDKISLGSGIIEDLKNIIVNELGLKDQLQYIKFIGDDVDKSYKNNYQLFIKSLPMLCDKNECANYFKNDKLWDPNINADAIFQAICQLFINKKIYEYITAYYYIKYIFMLQK